MQFINAHGVSYEPDKWLSYDDVVLLPQPSHLPSRNAPSIDLSTNLVGSLKLRTPIISANMDTITESSMVLAMASRGAYGILHRFYLNEDNFLHDIRKVFEKTEAVAFSVGADARDLDKIDKVLSITNGSNTIVTVDVAHGHSKVCLDQVNRINKTFGSKIHIIAGNVATAQGVVDLVNAGANGIKVGIGSGSMCSTRVHTGHGTPQLTAIMMARRAINSLQRNITLIADGGIRNSGDIIKSLAAGADSVMIGKLFAATDEAPGKNYFKDGEAFLECMQPQYSYITNYKKYRGQSSEDFMKDIGKTGVAPEGECVFIQDKGSVIPILDNLIGGIRSGMTYSGVNNLEKLNERSIFVETTYHGYIEGTPHGKSNT